MPVRFVSRRLHVAGLRDGFAAYTIVVVIVVEAHQHVWVGSGVCRDHRGSI
jgi:hypothetical protein